jgi:hypothetical protein
MSGTLRIVAVLFLMSTMLCAWGQNFLLSSFPSSTTAANCHDDSMPSSRPDQQHQPDHACCLTGHNHAVPVVAVQITRSMVEVELINPISTQQQKFVVSFSAPTTNDTGPPLDYAVLRV